MSSEGPIAELPCANRGFAARQLQADFGFQRRNSHTRTRPLGRMSDRLPGNSGPSLGREYAEPVGRPHPGDGAKQQPSCGQFPGRPRPGNGTKQMRSGGESAGEPKACEAQVGNPNWVPELAPRLWRRKCVHTLDALSRQRGTPGGAERSAGPKTHINTSPPEPSETQSPIDAVGAHRAEWAHRSARVRHGGAWPLATGHASGRPTRSIASARAAQIARDQARIYMRRADH